MYDVLHFTISDWIELARSTEPLQADQRLTVLAVPASYHFPGLPCLALPCPALPWLASASSDRKYYTKANPAMVGTGHDELEYQARERGRKAGEEILTLGTGGVKRCFQSTQRPSVRNKSRAFCHQPAKPTCLFAPPVSPRPHRYPLETKRRPPPPPPPHTVHNAQVHYNCNPISAFHHDNVWLSFKEGEEEEKNVKDDDTYGGDASSSPSSGSSTIRPLYCGPPRVSGVGLTVEKRPAEFEDEPEEGKQQ